MQCHALVKLGIDLTLFAKSSNGSIKDLNSALKKQYGIDFSKVNLKTFWSRINKGDNLRIALNAIFYLLTNPQPDVIISRNLYASYVFAVLFRKPLIFETHLLEIGFKKYLQRSVMLCQHVATVVISKKLLQHLDEHHSVNPVRPFVLHDAAPEGLKQISFFKRRAELGSLIPQAKGHWRGVCGYFGHLYPGRGIEIIETMANERPDVLFLVFGGNEIDIQSKRKKNNTSNLQFMGHIVHDLALKVMRALDILLMPYQKNVSIGVIGHDTARWMSPMKMFEYMGSAVPIISSDLPVLREILRDGQNALLVPPADPNSWIQAMDRLLSDQNLCMKIGSNAYKAYKSKHTWLKRAKAILSIAKTL